MPSHSTRPISRPCSARSSCRRGTIRRSGSTASNSSATIPTRGRRPRRLFNVVKNSVLADPNVKAYYFPTYEQYPVAQQNRDWFAEPGHTDRLDRAVGRGQCELFAKDGPWGRSSSFPAPRFRPRTPPASCCPTIILLTDGVPAEVPSVAGIISLMPSTPNSHVAILSRSQGVPFVHLAVESDAARARALVGHSVYLAVTQRRVQLILRGQAARGRIPDGRRRGPRCCRSRMRRRW